MAQSMAKQGSKIFVWILLSLLIVGLAGFGATNFGGSVNNVATVGKAEISVNEYARALQSELSSLEAQMGTSIPLSMAVQFGVDQQVLARLVRDAALENEATRLGLSVGDANVRDQIVAIPAFQGIDGKFDRQAYEFTLKQNGLSTSEFEDNIRTDLSRNLLEQAVVGGVSAAPNYGDLVVAWQLEKRDGAYAILTAADLTDPVPAPTEAQLTEYYDANPEAYTLPRTKRITYALLTPDMVMDQLSIDEATVRQLYDDRADEYLIPERRLVERLVFGTEAEAQAAMDALNAGETTFEALVADRGLSLADIDLGDVTPGALGEAGEAIFALTEPGIVGPLPTNLGPALFRMNGILFAQETTFDEVKDELTAELLSDDARRAVADRITDLDDMLAGGATLEDLASETAMELGQIDWYAGLQDDIAAYAEFQAAAAEVTEDDYPEIIEMSDGAIFALRLDEVIEPTVQPQADVADQLLADWTAAETRARLKAQAEDLATTAAGDPAALEAAGLTVTRHDGLTRADFLETAPSGFVQTLFSMEAQSAKTIDAGDAGVAVVQLLTITPADTTDPEAEGIRTAAASAVAQSISLDLFQQFSDAIRAQSGVSLNQAAINAVHAQFP